MKENNVKIGYSFGVFLLFILISLIPCINGYIEIQDETFDYNSIIKRNIIKTSGTPKEIWNKTYGDKYNNFGFYSDITDDEGLVVTGFTQYNSPPKWNDAIWIKTDENGNEKWYKQWGGNFFDEGHDIQQTNDGGYIITGVTHLYILLIETDENGTVIWNKSIPGEYNGVGMSVRQTSDGGYVISGYTEHLRPDEHYNCVIIKTDENGNETWRNIFSGIIFDSYGFCVQETGDGGFIIAGATMRYSNDTEDAWLIKINSSGKEQWNITFDGPKEGDSIDEFYYVLQTNDSGYIATGLTSSTFSNSADVWVVKTDTNGNVLWDQTFGGVHNEACFSIENTIDEGFIMAGTSNSYSAGDYDMLLIKLNASGLMEWIHTIGGNLNETGFSVHQNDDGTYLISGYTYSYGEGNADVWLVKVGVFPEPDLNCIGHLNWNEVIPGYKVEGNLSIKNIGDPTSQLDWEICDWPTWGQWTFYPADGLNLTPEEGELIVKVDVIAPNMKNSEFTGQIKIKNKENSSDYCTIDVKLVTPKSKKSTGVLDPGGIRGPIFGTIRGYEFTEPYEDHLVLDAIRLRYFGIGYAFNAGFYPRIYRHRQITFSYPNFKGKITPHLIFGIISGLPGD
jgi:hypothetical protein